jgi:hypothetical protein
VTSLDDHKLYKLAQARFSWLGVAEHLEAAAEREFSAAVALEPAYAKAYDDASRKLEEGAKQAEIEAETPSYLPGFLLYGYAVENLLKGLIAANTPEIASEIESSAFKGHVSPELAARAKFEPDEQQARLIEKLETIVLWRARYPVALKIRDQGVPGLDKEDIVDPSVDIEGIRKLYATLHAVLEAHVGNSRSKHDLLGPCQNEGAAASWRPELFGPSSALHHGKVAGNKCGQGAARREGR